MNWTIVVIKSGYMLEHLVIPPLLVNYIGSENVVGRDNQQERL